MAQWGKQYHHYLWTIDKTLIPETVKYAESHGFIMRDLRELKGFDDFWKGVFKYYLDNSPASIGLICDLARMLIVIEEGGFYLDLDFYLESWDQNMMHYFDFFSFRDRVANGFEVVGTWGFGAKPHHEVVIGHLAMFKENFIKPVAKRNLGTNTCFHMIAEHTYYATGPVHFGIVYYKHHHKNGNQDIVFLNPMELHKEGKDLEQDIINF